MQSNPAQRKRLKIDEHVTAMTNNYPQQSRTLAYMDDYNKPVISSQIL